VRERIPHLGAPELSGDAGKMFATGQAIHIKIGLQRESRP